MNAIRIVVGLVLGALLGFFGGACLGMMIFGGKGEEEWFIFSFAFYGTVLGIPAGWLIAWRFSRPPN
jgi:hypothetical protein